jgi:hypothetical protein
MLQSMQQTFSTHRLAGRPLACRAKFSSAHIRPACAPHSSIYSPFRPRNTIFLTYSGNLLIVRLCSPIPNPRSVTSLPALDTSPTSHDGITAGAVETSSATCTPCMPSPSTKTPITIQRVAAAAPASTAGPNIAAGNWHAPAGQTARARMTTRKHPLHLS